MSKAKTLAVSVSDAGALVNSVPTSSVGSVLTLKEATANGTNVLELKAPATLAANLAFTLPSADGTSGQLIKTDGAGNLSFAAVTGTGNVVLATNPTLAGATLSGELVAADQLVTRANLKDYSVEGSAIGNTGASRTFDLTVANFFSATLNQASTFTFSNPPGSGDFGCFVLELTNGGAFAITWPGAVDWPGGTAPTLTAAGVDQLVFTTRDAGTTWFGFVAGLDIKSP